MLKYYVVLDGVNTRFSSCFKERCYQNTEFSNHFYVQE